MSSIKIIGLPWFFCLMLSACATYDPQPLNSRPTLADNIAHISIDPRQMPLPELAAHVFDPTDGLDMTEVAMLAVVNNPDLKMARNDARVATAQAFAAGLLPDPQITASRDIDNSGGPGSTKAFSFGLSYDFIALLTHSTTHAAAASDARKTDLNLLWQEWQVISQARLLFVKLTQAQTLMHILQGNRDLFADRYRRTKIALDQGLLTIDVVTPNLTALQDVKKQINDLERQLNQNRHDLNTLLGLAPEVSVPLQGDATLPALDEASIQAILPNLARRRPDLIALEAGYWAEDFRYRAAILAQFPTLNIGLTRARDSSDIYSKAFGITISLPIFNRNRGNIAIEKATREKLHEDYQQRLNKSIGDIYRIIDEQRINMRQLAEVNLSIAELSQAAEKANIAFQVNNIDVLAFSNLRATLQSKKIEKNNLQQSILEQRVALQTLLGGELPMHSLQKGVFR